MIDIRLLERFAIFYGMEWLAALHIVMLIVFAGMKT